MSDASDGGTDGGEQMNLDKRCGRCRDFEAEDARGFGHCRPFDVYTYKGNCEPCFAANELDRIAKQHTTGGPI